MPTALSDTGQRLLAYLPPLLEGSYDAQAVIDTAARELDRLEAEVENVRDNLFPQTAGDYLRLWERLLGLSVDPPDKTVQQRRLSVMAYLSSLGSSGTGLDWEGDLSSLIGTAWTYTEYLADPPTNLVINPRGYTATTGWSIQGSGGEVLSRTSSPAPDCPFSTALQCTLNNNTRIHVAGLAVVPGDVVRWSGWVRLSTAGNTPGVDVALYTEGFSGPSWYASATAAEASAGWVHLAVEATMTTAQTLNVFVHGNGNGTMQWSGMMLTKNEPQEYDYFDGDSLNYEWNGTPHASTSSLISPPANTVRITIPYADALATPDAPTGTAYASGGSLASATYSYRITATNIFGETLPSPALSKTVTGPSGRVVLNWTAVTGATGYNVYRSTSGDETFLVSVTDITYTDTGAVTPSTTPLPTENTTKSTQAYEIETFARSITPAHIDLLIGYETGFLLNISLIGEEAL